ncbi:Protein kinase [Hondaea fermentalgiana]|uniref:Cyclin-dependent kinase 2 homolog n=1 Tax=Hondaea fermentalgiana TaxID=2315210 RepID=A0A2R5GEY2_9STRA|nr:Protein kinase [Hondaea fermentalgiana]|eukprot:GBG28288.1 Protein kinase [Hondaea fermentalgiana]
MEAYRLGGALGGGTFGSVFSARRKACKAHEAAGGEGEEGEVALKKVALSSTKWVPSAALREVLSLRLTDGHPNVVRLLDVFAHGLSLCLVMELAHIDMDVFLETNAPRSKSNNSNNNNNNISMSFKSQEPMWDEAMAKYLGREILQGVAHLHSCGIMHRDLKPGNVLMWKDGRVKLGDFGLARSFRYEDGRTFSHQIMTRWFRAPEILFGSRRYDATVDVWAIGVIFGTFLNACETLFPGDNDIDQISRVAHLLGSHPWTAEADADFVPDVGKLVFPDTDRILLTALAKRCPQASSDYLHLVDTMLQYVDRPTAQDCLHHEVFITDPLPQFSLDVMHWPSPSHPQNLKHS